MLGLRFSGSFLKLGLRSVGCPQTQISCSGSCSRECLIFKKCRALQEEVAGEDFNKPSPSNKQRITVVV